MFFNQPETQRLLQKIAGKFASETLHLEDLYQVALAHFWELENASPHQTRSWYLQSCQHCLQDYLRSGRSVDSPKRQHGRVAGDGAASGATLPTDDDGADENAWSEEEAVSTASFHDLFEKLRSAANPTQVRILGMLSDGFNVSDIARKIGVSHTAIGKQRQGLAALACRFGVAPPAVGLPQKTKLSLTLRKL